jgi:hypothetical protein
MSHNWENFYLHKIRNIDIGRHSLLCCRRIQYARYCMCYLLKLVTHLQVFELELCV